MVPSIGWKADCAATLSTGQRLACWVLTTKPSCRCRTIWSQARRWVSPPRPLSLNCTRQLLPRPWLQLPRHCAMRSKLTTTNSKSIRARAALNSCRPTLSALCDGPGKQYLRCRHGWFGKTNMVVERSLDRASSVKVGFNERTDALGDMASGASERQMTESSRI